MFKRVAIDNEKFGWGVLQYAPTMVIFFLVFLYLSARKINNKLAYLSILFWALNPYLMMINYSFFMPDIFMMGAFVGGIYFWMKAIENNNKQINQNLCYRK